MNHAKGNKHFETRYERGEYIYMCVCVCVCVSEADIIKMLVHKSLLIEVIIAHYINRCHGSKVNIS